MPRKDNRAVWNQPVTINGIEKTLKRWVALSGLQLQTVLNRVGRGVPPFVALTTPDREGNYLRPSAGTGIWDPFVPLAIGRVTRSALEWVLHSWGSMDRVAALVEGGLSPFEALTRGHWRSRRFWERYWTEQFNQTAADLQHEAYADAEARRLAEFYITIRSSNEHDPVAYYCLRRVGLRPFSQSAAEVASDYPNLDSNGWVHITAAGRFLPDPDEIEFFTGLEGLVCRIRQDLADRPGLWASLATEHRTDHGRDEYEKQLRDRLTATVCDLLDRLAPPGAPGDGEDDRMVVFGDADGVKVGADQV